MCHRKFVAVKLCFLTHIAGPHRRPFLSSFCRRFRFLCTCTCVNFALFIYLPCGGSRLWLFWLGSFNNFNRRVAPVGIATVGGLGCCQRLNRRSCRGRAGQTPNLISMYINIFPYWLIISWRDADPGIPPCCYSRRPLHPLHGTPGHVPNRRIASRSLTNRSIAATIPATGSIPHPICQRQIRNPQRHRTCTSNLMHAPLLNRSKSQDLTH